MLGIKSVAHKACEALTQSKDGIQFCFFIGCLFPRVDMTKSVGFYSAHLHRTKRSRTHSTDTTKVQYKNRRTFHRAQNAVAPNSCTPHRNPSTGRNSPCLFEWLDRRMIRPWAIACAFSLYS